LKFWQAVTWMEPEQMLDVARFAEAVGFSGLMLGDHGVFPENIQTRYPYSADGKPPMTPDSYYPDCWASIGAMAAVTTRIRFSVGVYVLPLRNVFEVARAAGTLSIFSANRFILGVGTGWMKEEFDIYGVDFHTRGRRYEEMIAVLHKLWAGGMVEHHGELIDFPRLQISPAPAQPIPIYMGGAAPVALERTARVADGWIGAGNTPDEVPRILSSLRELRERAGRAHLPFEAVFGLSTPPDVDTFRRLEAQGMTTGIAYPFKYALGPLSALDDKKRVMEDFARRIIEPCR
jgi:probable F420-dependent oxidoreductase